MKPSTIAAIASALVLAGCQVPGLTSAPDVSGTWVVSTGTTMTLKQEGIRVTGTFAPSFVPFPLEGRLEGRRLTAIVSWHGLGEPSTVDMTLEGDQLEGTIDGERATARRR